MLVSPASTNATLPNFWGKMKRSKNDTNALIKSSRMLTLAYGDMETVKILPASFADLEAVARSWAQPAPNAPFALRVPVQYASPQASRFIHGDYIYIHDDESYHIATMGVHGLYVEVCSDTPPPEDPPPPPPPPVLEMPATFNLELAPGQVVAIDTICESDELDMSRTEDGTVVGGMFMGKLDIVHDHVAKIHKMEFTGTRLKDEEFSPDFFFDARTMGKLTVAARPSIAKCHLSVMSPDQQYCDVTLTLSPFWSLGNTWPPVEPLEGGKAKFFLRVNRGGAMEHFESQAVVTSLFYEAIPNPSAIEPTNMIGPHNGYAMATSQFVPHLFKVLESLGLSPASRTNFVSGHLGNFFAYKNIAYRFMSPNRLAQAIDLSVTCSPCVWTRIFLLFRGISDNEMGAFAGAGEKDIPEDHWRNIIGWQEQSQNKEAFRIFETSILEIN
ncbi:hypothetical protein M422DRAFT_30591 [Sphaerobolus stellatus SS14]|uniref:Uncharacterized protein n=1 Tax=Sphaerobolus stellatus (strain SS14) TaxID=990650 RepID=A0A0C9VYG0_SPHS4|nr:hypothetical protein M422DRAFT_30591 [Sphaerobolus stellatus SS14]